MLTNEELSKALNAAVEAHLVSRDSARLVRGWMDSEGRIAAPNERCAELAREVLEAAGVEYRPAKAPDLPATPGEMEQTGPEREAPDADRRETTGKGTGRSKPSTRSAAARSRSAAAWARKHPVEAATMLAHHPMVVDELLADDAADSEDGVELREVVEYLAVNDDLERVPQAITGRVFQLASRLPSSMLGGDDEPLSLLAAAWETLGADVRRGMLPAVPRTNVVQAPEDKNTLPVAPTPERRQLVLPRMPRPERELIAPAAWLQVFDSLGGNYMAQGRGVPVELRLFVEALAWAPPAARRGVLAEVRLKVRDLVEAVWPLGWQRGRDLPKLIRGIDRISAFGVLSDGRFRWRPLWFLLSPDLGAGLDDPVRVYIQLPKVADAGTGARFDRKTLRRLGLRSAPAYRLYLALVEQWDRKLNRGVTPYTPEGRESPMPLPGFSPDERRRLIFGPDETAGNASTLRSRGAAAERAFSDLERDGVIEVVRDEDDPRIYRPRRLDLN